MSKKKMSFWGKREGAVFITGKAHHPELKETAAVVAAWFKRRGLGVLTDETVGRLPGTTRARLDEAAPSLSLAVVLGGDGTILGTARRLGDLQVPILGVNLGGLGFLAETTRAEAPAVLEGLDRGDYLLDERMMLDCRVLRHGRTIGSYTVLNDAVINKGALARIIGIEARLGDNHLTRYRGDGVIVSTPTGSTAYAMAAGGPIVYPMMDALVLVPICAHILANRAIVIPPEETVVLELESGGEDITLTLDGQEGLPLELGDQVEVTRSERRTLLIHAGSYNYYQVLRRKLKWGEF